MLGERAVVGGDHPRVAVRGEVLHDPQAEGAGGAEGAHVPPVERRAVRVGAVLDQDELVVAREGEERSEVDGEPVEVDDEQAAGVRRESSRQVVRVGTEVVEPDVHRDGLRAGLPDRLDGGDERVGLHEDLGPGAEPRGGDGERQRVGARRHPADVPYAEIGRGFGFERTELLTAEELHPAEHALARREQLGTKHAVLPP